MPGGDFGGAGGSKVRVPGHDTRQGGLHVPAEDFTEGGRLRGDGMVDAGQAGKAGPGPGQRCAGGFPLGLRGGKARFREGDVGAGHLALIEPGLRLVEADAEGGNAGFGDFDRPLGQPGIGIGFERVEDQSLARAEQLVAGSFALGLGRVDGGTEGAGLEHGPFRLKASRAWHLGDPVLREVCLHRADFCLKPGLEAAACAGSVDPGTAAFNASLGLFQRRVMPEGLLHGIAQRDRLSERNRCGERQQADGEPADKFHTHLNALPGFRPMALKISAAGQKPVNAAWNMFSPANAVSRNQ